MNALRVRAPHNTEITWQPEPVPTYDPLALADDELAVVSVQDAESYRRLAQVALGRLHELTCKLDRARETIARLREELRRYAAAQIARAK